MDWIAWALALVAFAAAGLLYRRWSEERSVSQRLRNERMQLADEIESMQGIQARLLQMVPMSVVGQMAAGVIHEVDSPLGLARSNVDGISELLDDYRKLVKNYDSAVQYCLQPVEMIFGADKAGLDQLVKHVEEARRQLFSARRELEKSAVLDESKAMLADALLGLERSSTLVQSLRRLSRADADGLDSTSVNETVDAALDLLSPGWGDRIEIVREYAELPNISCMPAQICRAFIYILDNAARAIEGNGRVLVQTRAGGARNVEIRFGDSGSGIADDVLPDIFEPFFSTSPDAVGLGLSVASGIVKAHGGSINVRTKSDGGTTIVVSLPIMATTLAAAAAVRR